MSIELRRLTLEDETAFGEALRVAPNEPGFIFMPDWIYKAGQPFAGLVQRLSELEKGIGLPSGYVPDTSFFAFNSSAQIVGRISIRHRLNDFLLRIGGHIGYGVLPEFRRRGYASEMLKRSLPFCRKELGLNKVLLTCDDDNLGSIRTIENNGGVLENTITDSGLRTPKRRYWIELS